MDDDYTQTLAALKTISTLLTNKNAEAIGHGTWVAAGLPKGSTAKAVNERIHFVRQLISAHNKAETHYGDDDTGAMAGGATFKDVGSRGKSKKKEWSKGANRSSARDKKMLTASAQIGDMDMNCDRLFYGNDGNLQTL